MGGVGGGGEGARGVGGGGERQSPGKISLLSDNDPQRRSKTGTSSELKIIVELFFWIKCGQKQKKFTC